MDYLTTSEAAELLRVHRDYVGRLCARGRIAGAVRRAETWFIPPASILAFTRVRRPVGRPRKLADDSAPGGSGHEPRTEK